MRNSVYRKLLNMKFFLQLDRDLGVIKNVNILMFEKNWNELWANNCFLRESCAKSKEFKQNIATLGSKYQKRVISVKGGISSLSKSGWILWPPVIKYKERRQTKHWDLVLTRKGTKIASQAELSPIRQVPYKKSNS